MLSKKNSAVRKVILSKCKICRGLFQRRSMTHKVCGNVECAIEWARRERIRKERAAGRVLRNQIRERKEAIKTRSDWIKDAQKSFNAYIRARDAGKPCICCGSPLGSNSVGGSYDCGHYRSIGSAPHLRFSEDNANAQKKQCNRWGAGRAVDYRIGLIQRIGLARVEALEADNEARKFTIERLREIRDHYRARLKDLRQTERLAA